MDAGDGFQPILTLFLQYAYTESPRVSRGLDVGHWVSECQKPPRRAIGAVGGAMLFSGRDSLVYHRSAETLFPESAVFRVFAFHPRGLRCRKIRKNVPE